MAKVLFINPTVREEDEPKHVPYGIALLAAIAIDKGHQVQVYDENAWRQGNEVLREVLEADDWDIIALGSITTAYGAIKRIVKLAREIYPVKPIVLGGGVLTSLPTEIMGFLPEVTLGVVGEAFITFTEILDKIDQQKTDWGAIDGIIFRGNKGEITLSSQRELIPELDVLPYPAWDLFPLEEVYFPNSQVPFSEEGMIAKRRLDINGSFGCSLICRYCYHLGLSGDMRYEKKKDSDVIEVAFDQPGNYSRNIRYHSPEYIVDMVKHVHDKYGVDFISFLDENLMTIDQYSKRTWIQRIGELWIEKGLQPSCIRDSVEHDENCKGVHWAGTSHATLCNPEILKFMRSFGCSYLIYGYESFAPHVMKKIGKGATPKTNMRSFFWTIKSGIRPVPNQMMGFPNEDFESIYLNMEAWKNLGIVVKPFFTTPYPGSEWFTVYRQSIEAQYNNDLEAYILDLGDATKITVVISHNFTAIELLGLREAMLTFDYKHIKDYESFWRKAHNISEGEPSTLYQETKNKVMAMKENSVKLKLIK